MNNFSLNTAVKVFDQVTETPTNFLVVNEQLSNDIKSNIKAVYDFTKKEEIEPRTKNSLSKLFIKELDSEQIWQQVDIQNDNVLTNFINKISVLLVDRGKLQFKDLEVEDTTSQLDSNSDDEDQSSEQGENGASNMNDTIDNSDTEESSSDNEEGFNEKKQAGASIVDDNFFKLSEMENFLNLEEKKLADPGFHNNSDSDESEGEGSIDLFKENNEMSLDQEDESKLARFKDYFVAKEAPQKQAKRNKLEELVENSDSENDLNNEIKSSLKLRQEKLKRKIDKLEEQAVSEKPWQLKGEITAESRPQNSLLAEVVGFDLTSRPAPVITEQASLQLEDIIRQRLKDKVFDSVERKTKPVETPLEYRKKIVLDQEKSKQSLTQIYEQDFVKQQADLDPANADREEQEPKLHEEVKTLMKSLFSKLDALSNYHFTSKPTVPELKIVSHLPAINMEEVAPVATSDATLLAPEEIRNKDKGIIGKSEKTNTDKKRERRRKKLKQKIHSQLKLKKEKLKQASSKGKKGLIF